MAKILLRLPDELHTALKASSDTEHRSLNSEIISAIEFYLTNKHDANLKKPPINLDTPEGRAERATQLQAEGKTPTQIAAILGYAEGGGVIHAIQRRADRLKEAENKRSKEDATKKKKRK